MEGTLAYQHVDDGAAVEAGEPICDIEVMKMMTSIETPVSGIVRFLVQLGEIVGFDDIVAEIETK